MAGKLYFSEFNDEVCSTIAIHKSEMEEMNITEMVLFEARRETNSDYFWCKEFKEIGEKDQDTCGKYCSKYEPKNGKSGCCKHYGYMYEHTELAKILKK